MNTSSMIVSCISSLGTKARIVSSRGALAVFTASTLFACSVGESYTADEAQLRSDTDESVPCGCGPHPGDTGSGSTGTGQGPSATTSVGAGGASGSGATTGAGGASGGGGISCIHDSDCPASISECSASKCMLGVCAQTNMSAGTQASSQVSGDCHRRVCDGGGGVTTVVDDTDAPTEVGTCSAPSCKYGTIMKTQRLEGAWCSGGICNKSGGCVECLRNADCNGGTCSASGQCLPATCSDGVKNGTECDVDCGQGCKPCGSGKSCSHASECTLGVCVVALGAALGICL